MIAPEQIIFLLLDFYHDEEFEHRRHASHVKYFLIIDEKVVIQVQKHAYRTSKYHPLSC